MHWINTRSQESKGSCKRPSGLYQTVPVYLSSHIIPVTYRTRNKKGSLIICSLLSNLDHTCMVFYVFKGFNLFTERLNLTKYEFVILCPLFNCVRYLFTYFITKPCYCVPSSVPWKEVKAHSWIGCLLFATQTTNNRYWLSVRAGPF